MLSELKNFPIVDETWWCHGRHSKTGGRQALLVWRGTDSIWGVVSRFADAVGYARAIQEMVEQQSLQVLPRFVKVMDVQVARLLSQVLGRFGVDVQHVSEPPSDEVDAFISEFILGAAASEAAPRGKDPGSLQSALTSLCADKAWLDLPMNLSVLVKSAERGSFGVLVHADCCPGFTVLPVDAQGRARDREGTVTLRFMESERLGVGGRWPLIVEELAVPSMHAFSAPQRRLTAHVAERVLASADLVLQLGRRGGKVPRNATLEQFGKVTCKESSLGVISCQLPFGDGDQHVRLRVRAA
jgi:hypothetical protein